MPGSEIRTVLTEWWVLRSDETILVRAPGKAMNMALAITPADILLKQLDGRWQLVTRLGEVSDIKIAEDRLEKVHGTHYIYGSKT